ncbi:MAG TPA: RsmG family class I SAM-dependent methyltransferase [Acidimicrobiales bacterium]|nr:RsmG family class I SAM-dependent methyltransferase [Acidimicrobiales bacterium]
MLEALGRSRAHGFLGPGDLGPQVDHALGFAAALSAASAAMGRRGDDRPTAMLDLGSGGGLPGLVLAERWGEATVVLLDAAERRTAFLQEEVDALGWGTRVRVVRDRAESAGHLPELRGRFDLVVARSFGPPPVTAECGAPFLRIGGLMIVSEPPAGGPRALEGTTVDAEADAGTEGTARWPAGDLAELGLQAIGTYGDLYRFRVMVQADPCPERYPRRVGVPAKRPLYRVPEAS